MKQKKYQLNDFIEKERFELSSYITHLFEYYKTRSIDEKTRKKSCRKMNLEQSS